MALDATNIVTGNVVLAADVLQFYNALTGAMTDQIFTLKNLLKQAQWATVAPGTTTLALPTSSNFIQITNSQALSQVSGPAGVGVWYVLQWTSATPGVLTNGNHWKLDGSLTPAQNTVLCGYWDGTDFWELSRVPSAATSLTGAVQYQNASDNSLKLQHVAVTPFAVNTVDGAVFSDSSGSISWPATFAVTPKVWVQNQRTADSCFGCQATAISTTTVTIKGYSSVAGGSAVPEVFGLG